MEARRERWLAWLNAMSGTRWGDSGWVRSEIRRCERSEHRLARGAGAVTAVAGIATGSETGTGSRAGRQTACVLPTPRNEMRV